VKNLNVLLITIDAWRFDALGAAPDHHWLRRYGLENLLSTPNLEQLANESLYFTQALSTAPHTTVSHASIMTGLFPPQHGVRSFFYESLPQEITTLAEHFKKNGYKTIALREAESLQEPGLLEKVNVLRGFDHVINNLDQLVTISKSDGDQPIFAFLHFWDLHAPYLYSVWASQNGALELLENKTSSLAAEWGIPLQAGKQVSERSAMEFQKNLASKIRDTQLRIRTLFEWYLEGVNWFDNTRLPYLAERLKAAGLWEDTVHILFGDHGEGVHPDGVGFKAFEHSQSLLDDVLRVPLLIHGIPNQTPSRINEQVSLVDIFPTALELAGIPVTRELFGEAEFHGNSLLGSADTSLEKERYHIAELCIGDQESAAKQSAPQRIYQRCIRTSRNKLVAHQPPFIMKRYQLTEDRIQKVINKSNQLMNRLALDGLKIEKPVNLFTGKERFYFTNLLEDPDELRPGFAGEQKSAEFSMLKQKLELAYRAQRWGSPINSEDLDHSILIERLADLGYVGRN